MSHNLYIYIISGDLKYVSNLRVQGYTPDIATLSCFAEQLTPTTFLCCLDLMCLQSWFAATCSQAPNIGYILFPECVARVPVSLGGLGVMLCSGFCLRTHEDHFLGSRVQLTGLPCNICETCGTTEVCDYQVVPK